MSDLTDSLRTFQAALKQAEKNPADAYADDVAEFVKTKIKPLLKEVKDLHREGKQLKLRFEADRLEKLIAPLETLVDDIS